MLGSLVALVCSSSPGAALDVAEVSSMEKAS